MPHESNEDNNALSIKMKILIASGSFKDVYSPRQACNMIKDVLTSINIIDEYNVDIIPMADGGEYSSEVLAEALNCKKIYLNDIVNAWGKKTTSHYLEFSKDTAFIGSSEILRLSPRDEEYKNPLILTSYGLGQLIGNAINRGYQNILVGLGGTSTVDCGVGLLQALGGVFYRGGERYVGNNSYLNGSDLKFIDKIDITPLQQKMKNINLTTLCDANTSVTGMNIPTNQKIGMRFESGRKMILTELKKSANQFCLTVQSELESKNRWAGQNLTKAPYLGVAGGINIGLLTLFNHKAQLGSAYFSSLLGLENKVRNSNLIITGEGKFDNSLEGKTPIGVCLMAKKYNKQALFLCGDISQGYKKHFNSYFSSQLPKNFLSNGISGMISCHQFYDNSAPPDKYADKIHFYIKNNPKCFMIGLEQYFKKRELD